jgi:hypothetical protein
MREEKQKTIDGIGYTFFRHMPKSSFKLFNRLMKIIAPTIAAGVGESTSFKDAYDKDINLADAVKVLCQRMDEQEIDNIVGIILSKVMHNGSNEKSVKAAGNCRDNFDAAFINQSVVHIYKVILQALKVEYDTFFVEGAGIGTIVDKAKDLIREQ